jgi:hypothetical protein
LEPGNTPGVITWSHSAPPLLSLLWGRLVKVLSGWVDRTGLGHVFWWQARMRSHRPSGSVGGVDSSLRGQHHVGVRQPVTGSDPTLVVLRLVGGVWTFGGRRSVSGSARFREWRGLRLAVSVRSCGWRGRYSSFSRSRRKGWHTTPGRRTETNRTARNSSTGPSLPDRGVQPHSHHRKTTRPAGQELPLWRSPVLRIGLAGRLPRMKIRARGEFAVTRSDGRILKLRSGVHRRLRPVGRHR